MAVLVTHARKDNQLAVQPVSHRLISIDRLSRTTHGKRKPRDASRLRVKHSAHHARRAASEHGDDVMAREVRFLPGRLAQARTELPVLLRCQNGLRDLALESFRYRVVLKFRNRLSEKQEQHPHRVTSLASTLSA